MSFSGEEETKRLITKLPFYNVLIVKPKIKNLNNVNILSEVPFYDKLNIVKTPKAFKIYAKSYSIEIMKDRNENLNDPLAQLEASKPIIKDLFRELLIEMKGFKYQLTMKAFLSSQQKKMMIENLLLLILILLLKKVIGSKDGLGKLFEEILYRLDNWINEGSARIIEYLDAEYINISIYSPLSGSILNCLVN